MGALKNNRVGTRECLLIILSLNLILQVINRYTYESLNLGIDKFHIMTDMMFMIVASILSIVFILVETAKVMRAEFCSTKSVGILLFVLFCSLSSVVNSIYPQNDCCHYQDEANFLMTTS